jgi:hypothetical protein
MDVDVPLGSMDVDVTNIHGYPSNAFTAINIGLGRYLQSINEGAGLSWQGNLAHIYIACEIHLRRAAEQAVGIAN